MTGDLAPAESVMDAAEARALTDRVKVGLEGIWLILADVYERRGWQALGYATWDAYCTREYGTCQLQIPREDRPVVLPIMRARGMSLRAIESATGVSRSSAQRVLAAVPNGTAAPPALTDAEHGAALAAAREAGDLSEDGVDRAAAQILSAGSIQPDKVTGVDGKPYPARQPEPVRQRRRRPLPDAWRDAAWEYQRATARLQKLINDNRFPAYAATAARAIYGPIEMSLAISQDMEMFLSDLARLEYDAERGWYNPRTDEDEVIWSQSGFLAELWAKRDAERRGVVDH